jgi:hypothetical protein
LEVFGGPGASDVLAQEPQPGLTRSAVGPFQKLFRPSAQVEPPAQPPRVVPPGRLTQALKDYLAANNGLTTPKVICGMIVVPANPDEDPDMIRPLPEGRFTMRIERPQVCAD